MRNKKLIVVIAMILLIVTVASTVAVMIVAPKSTEPEKKTEETPLDSLVDELYVKELLDGESVDKIINDPEWKDCFIDSTENYVVVESDKFDFSKGVGVEDGYTNIYFDTETREIESLQHNYVTYTNDLSPKEELENLIGNVQGNITKLLGNPSQSFMLMNTSGEFIDYDGLSIDEMIEKLLEGGHVLYVMYECNGLRYEMNIMFSDDTIFSVVWIYNEVAVYEDVSDS